MSHATQPWFAGQIAVPEATSLLRNVRAMLACCCSLLFCTPCVPAWLCTSCTLCTRTRPCCGCWTWLLLTRTPSPRDHIVTEIGWSVPRSQVPIVRSPSPSTLPAALTLFVSALLACAANACNAPCGPTASHTHPLAANPSPSGTRCTCCTCGQALRRRESCRSRSARCMRRARTQPLATLSIETSTSQGALHLHSTRTHPSLPQHAAGSSCGAMTTLHSHVVAITTTPLGRSCQRRC
jgi:hypothetical protein